MTLTSPVAPVFVLTVSFDSGLIVDEHLWDSETLARRLDEVTSSCPDAELTWVQVADETVTEPARDETSAAVDAIQSRDYLAPSRDYLDAAQRMEAQEIDDREADLDTAFWNHSERLEVTAL